MGVVGADESLLLARISTPFAIEPFVVLGALEDEFKLTLELNMSFSELVRLQAAAAAEDDETTDEEYSGFSSCCTRSEPRCKSSNTNTCI